MAKVLITGVTGLLGRHLSQALLARGDTVQALVLPGEDTSQLEKEGVVVFRGDVRDSSSLVRPVCGVDKIYNLAGMMGQWRPYQDYYDVNVTGAENVCNASLAAGVSRLVHISSWTVYGMGVPYTANEDTPFKPLSEPYALTKTKGDRTVQRFIKGNKLPAVIIRPDTFIGPGDRVHFSRMADKLLARSAIVVGSGRNLLPFCYVSDIVQGILLAGDVEAAIGQAYNIGNDQLMTQEQLWRAIAEAVGAKPPFVHVPYYPLFWASAVIEKAAILAKSRNQPIITRVGAKIFGTESRHSIEKARRDLNYSPRISMIEGVRLTANWYLSNRPKITGENPQ
jgi:nucleoside-diphosphate-sugar epimerase